MSEIKSKAPALAPEQVMTLVGAGKDQALRILSEAVSSSKTPEEMSHAVFSVQVMACHVLANCAINHEEQGGLNGDHWLDQTLIQIKKDLAFLREQIKNGKIKMTAHVENSEAQ